MGAQRSGLAGKLERERERDSDPACVIAGGGSRQLAVGDDALLLPGSAFRPAVGYVPPSGVVDDQAVAVGRGAAAVGGWSRQHGSTQQVAGWRRKYAPLVGEGTGRLNVKIKD